MRSTPTTSRSSARSTGGASSHSGRAPKASWNPSEASRSRTVMRTAGDTGGLLGRSMAAACHIPAARHGTRHGTWRVFLSGSRQPSGLGCGTMDAGGIDFSMYRLGAILILAAVLALAGCGPERPDTPAPAPTSAPPTRTLPPPTLRPGTTVVSSLPRLLRV